MPAVSNTLTELNIDEIFSDVIKKELIQVGKNQLGCNQIEFGVEHGSKKGA